MGNKKIREFVVKFQRTRVSDCTRLMFPPNGSPGWCDIDSDPYLQPIYEIPREKLFGIYRIDLGDGYVISLDTDRFKTYNDLVRIICRELCKIVSSEVYLWSIHFNPDKTGWIEFDNFKDNEQISRKED